MIHLLHIKSSLDDIKAIWYEASIRSCAHKYRRCEVCTLDGLSVSMLCADVRPMPQQ